MVLVERVAVVEKGVAGVEVEADVEEEGEVVVSDGEVVEKVEVKFWILALIVEVVEPNPT